MLATPRRPLPSHRRRLDPKSQKDTYFRTRHSLTKNGHSHKTEFKSRSVPKNHSPVTLEAFLWFLFPTPWAGRLFFLGFELCNVSAHEALSVLALTREVLTSSVDHCAST